MAVGWLMGIIRCMIFDLELDELINDYEVTTVSGLIMTELFIFQNREKN
jgi:hypothetical protein